MAKIDNPGKSIVPITLEQAKRAIIICFRAGIVPILWGPPGIGKSSLAAQVAQEMEYEYIVYRLTYIEPTDLGGYPYPSKDGISTSFLMPARLPLMGNPKYDDNSRVLVCYDEINRAESATLNAMTELLLDRTVNGFHLLPNTCQMATANVQDIGTAQMSEAVAARCCHLYIENKSQAAYDGYEAWARKNNIHNAVIEFGRNHQDIWAGRQETPTELAAPEPRSFDNVSRILQEIRRIASAGEFRTSDLTQPLFAGCVGAAAARAFVSYLSVFERAPAIKDVIENPDTADVPDNSSVLTAFALHLKRHLAELEGAEALAHAIAITQYAMRWPKEQSSNLMRGISETLPDIRQQDIHKEWLVYMGMNRTGGQVSGIAQDLKADTDGISAEKMGQLLKGLGYKE